MDEKLTQLSIKQRLKSAKTNNVTPRQPALSTSENKIFAPEQYNYFSHTIDREIKHEGDILQRIKKQIQEFKLKRKTKVKIKNSYEYEHKSFGPSLLRKHKISNQKSSNEIQSVNISRKASTAKTSNKLILSNVTHFFDEDSKHLETKVHTPLFKRSGCSTPLGYLQQYQKQIQTQISLAINNKQNFEKKTKKSQRFSKNNQFSIAGSQPIWKNFESYYRNSLRCPKSPLQ